MQNITFEDALKQTKLGLMLAFIQQVAQGSIDSKRFPLVALEVSGYIYPEWNLGFSFVEDEITLTDQSERKIVYRGKKSAFLSSSVADGWKHRCEKEDTSDLLTKMGAAVVKLGRQGYKGDFRDSEVYSIWKSVANTSSLD